VKIFFGGLPQRTFKILFFIHPAFLGTNPKAAAKLFLTGRPIQTNLGVRKHLLLIGFGFNCHSFPIPF